MTETVFFAIQINSSWIGALKIEHLNQNNSVLYIIINYRGYFIYANYYVGSCNKYKPQNPFKCFIKNVVLPAIDMSMFLIMKINNYKNTFGIRI